MRFLPSLPEEKLVELAKLTGGAATLVVVALFISGAATLLNVGGGKGFVAAAACAGGSCDEPVNGSTFHFDMPESVEAGQTASISWNVNPAPNPISFSFDGVGNGNTANTVLQSAPNGISGNSAHTTFPRADITSFTIGTDKYVSVLRNGSWAVYKFLPNGQSAGVACLGNTTTCGSTLGSVTITTPLSQRVFTIGADTYIAIGDSSTSPGVRIYKWNSGSNCFANSGSTCWSNSTVFQQIGLSAQSLDFFTISSGASAGDYLVVGNRNSPYDVRIYKWNSASNCFHNGTACASSSVTTGFKTIAVGSIPYAVKAFYRNTSDLYLAIGKQTSDTATDDLRIYKWFETGPSGAPCFGKNSSSACGSASAPYAPDTTWTSQGLTQSTTRVTSIADVGDKLYVGSVNGTINEFVWWNVIDNLYRTGTFGDTNARIFAATDGHQNLLLSGSFTSNSLSPKIYKCNGVDCNVSWLGVLLSSSQPTYAMDTFVVNGTWYLSLITNSGYLRFYKSMPPPPCLGNSTQGCNNVIKDPSGNGPLGGFTHHTFDWEPFKIGSTWYIARAAQSGYWYRDDAGNHIDYVNTPEHSMIYKWYPAYERFGDKVYVNSGSDKCYDGTTNCIDDDGVYGYGPAMFHAFQDFWTGGAYDWMTFTIGSDTYLQLSSVPGAGAVGSQLYKWGTQASKGTAGGLTGEYFNSEYLYGPSYSRQESGPVDFDYGSGKPSGVSVITSNNNFSVRWTGTIVASTTVVTPLTYTFSIDADDGVRLWLDDIMVIDNWNSAGGGSYTVANVQPGQNISVRLEYREVTGNARAKLYWSYSGQSTQIIPAENLYPNQVSTDGCLGNGKTTGTTCGSPFQNMAFSGFDSSFFTTASGNYLMLAGSSVKVLKWQSALGCFTASTTACDPFSYTQTISPFLPYTIATTTINSPTNPELYAAVGLNSGSNGVQIYRWRTSGGSGASLCPSTGLFGNTTNCDTSTSYQQLSPTYVKELQFFNPSLNGTLDTVKYLAVASEGNNAVYIYKWITGGSAPCNTTTGGGFGSGTSCGTALQTISFSFDPHTLEVFTINGNTYLIIKSSNDQETARVMKWQGSCFGDGGTCGNTYFSTTIPSSDEDTNAFLFFTPDNSTYYLGFGGEGSDPNNGPNWFDSTYLYKWIDPSAGSTPTPQSSCEVTWSNASGGSGSLGIADSAGPVITDPLDQDTTFTLTCADLGYMTRTITVTQPVTSFPQPPVSISSAAVDGGDPTVVEGGSPTDTGTFVVSYTGTASTSPIVVSYTVSGTAVADTDYTALSGTVTIPANQTSATITVSSPVGTNDTIYEGNETVIVTLVDSGGVSAGNYDLGTPTSATVTITDTETATTLPTNSGNAFTACTGTASATCAMGITPASIRRGNTVTVTWYVTGLITGSDVSHPGNTCTISASPNLAGFPKTSQAGDTQWINTGNSVKPTILQKTTFTFSCTAPDGTTKTTPVSKTINILPGFQEI